MGFRFFRRIKVAPGVTVNVSKSGLSTSFGPRGAKFTVGPKGVRKTAGIPGTGLYYTQQGGYGGGAGNGGSVPKQQAPPAMPAVPPTLQLGFIQRLTTPDEEKAFIQGCRAVIDGNVGEALERFSQSRELADAAFMGGLTAFKLERYEEAEDYFLRALNSADRPGRLLEKYNLTAGAEMPITGEISAFIGADRRGLLLALAEVCQQLGKTGDALNCLFELRKLAPDDMMVTLSLVEVYLDSGEDDPAKMKAVQNLTRGIENESPIHGALLLYRARAMRKLGLRDAARDILTKTLRRKKDRPPELMHALRYERACVYEEQGRKSRAREELEKIYAEDPDYEDIAEKLGVE